MLKITALASSSAGNCYTLDNGHSRLMIEAGIPWNTIKAKLFFELSGISGVLVSHGHGDHSKAVKDAARAGIDIYLSKATADALGATGHRIHHISSRDPFTVDEWHITPFDLKHDVECLGFVVITGKEKIVFLTDTAYCEYKFNRITHLMIEANFSNEILDRQVQAGIIDASRRQRLLESHFSLDRVKDFIRDNDMSKLKQVWLLHLSSGNSNAEQFKTEIQKMTGVPVYIA